jgi:fructose transport system permease protein
MPTEADNFEAAVKAPRDEAVAEFHENRGVMARFQHALHVTPALVPMIVLGVSILVFGLLLGSRFLSPASMSLILEQVQIVGIVAAAQTIVILTAGIDLSVGAIMVLSSIIMGQFTFRYGLPVEISIACGLAVGGLCGAINGWLIAVLKLPPFIVTLGTWQIFAATNYIYSANETIRSAEIDEVAPLLKFFANNFRFFANEEGRGGITITYGVIFMILLILLMAYVLRQTAWGRHVYAVGDDPEAAQMAGVNVKKTLISVYAVAGVICGFAGWAMIGRNGAVAPTAGQEANIDSITAAVIGGISLFGGRGSIVGAIFGAIIVGVFARGLTMMGTKPQETYFFIGVLIILAVGVDQWIRKVSK